MKQTLVFIVFACLFFGCSPNNKAKEDIQNLRALACVYRVCLLVFWLFAQQ